MEFKPFKIGKYLLLERLAMGGMAEVYRAKASGAGGFEKQLAIKRILPNYSQNDEFRRMFEYEARLSSQLTHANIVQIYDFVKSGETYLLAMEYVDGKNLRQFINKLKKANIILPIETGLYLINEVCKGLEYAHKKKDDLTGRPLNIIHRDMSPQNVMLSYEAGVKIVDFGIAKAKDRVDETRSGVIKGKFGYMSPEQANGEEVDHHTDIFSTGIILWELLTGKRLFATENDMATLKLIQECVIPPPSKLNPKVTPELEKIVLKGLAKDRTLRFQSAGLMQRALQEFLNKHFPSFSQKDVSDLVHRTFAEEITQEKKRYEQIYRQSIPFSQGVTTEEDDSMSSAPEEKADGESEEDEGITYSGSEGKTGETSAGDDEDLSQASAAASEELPSDYDDPRTMISQSFHPEELAEESKAAKAQKAERTENTQVESFSIEDTSLSGLGPDISWNSEMGTPGPKDQNEREDRTIIDTDSETDARSETPTEPRKQTAAAKSTAVTEARKPSSISGLTLEDSGANPRRERSASFIRNFETPASKESVKAAAQQSSNSVQNSGLSIDSGSFNEKPERESKSRSQPDEENIYADWRSQGPEPKVSLFSNVPGILMLLVALSGGFFLYNLYFGGGLKRLVDTVASVVSGKPSRPRQITQSPESVPPPSNSAEHPPNRLETEECSITFESEPALAQVYIDHKARGQTPTTLLVECNKSINYDLRRFGYETISENIYTKNLQEKVYKNLKPIPMGTLELSVTQNATIEIKEIDYKQEVKAQEWVEIPLRSGRRYRVFIYNSAMGMNGGYKEFAITEGIRIKEVIRLEEITNRQ